MKCFECGKKIDILADTCPFCGAEQYDDKPPVERVVRSKTKKKRKILMDFSEEEILAMGLYPKNETYKMALISIILGKQ